MPCQWAEKSPLRVLAHPLTKWLLSPPSIQSTDLHWRGIEKGPTQPVTITLSSHVTSTASPGMRVPAVEREKLKHREGKSLAEAHTASEAQSRVQKQLKLFPQQKMTVKLLIFQLSP